MKAKIIIIIISISAALMFMSGGYGYWEKTLVIKASIEVVAPPPLDESPMEETAEFLTVDEAGKVDLEAVIEAVKLESVDSESADVEAEVKTEAETISANETIEIVGQETEQSSFESNQ